jgi:hypothetical protein
VKQWGKYHVVIKNIDDPQVWDRFIDMNGTSTLFHKWNALKTVEKHTGYKLLTYGFYKTDELFAIFPLYTKSQYSIKMLFSPPPQTCIPYLGYILKDEFYGFRQEKKEEYQNLLKDDLLAEIKKINPDYIHVSLIPEINDVRQFIWNHYEIELNYTYILDLTADLEKIWAGFTRTRRQHIKKAEEMNIEIQNVENGDLLFEMITKRYIDQKLNSPIISKDYLNDLKKLYPDNISFHIAKMGEKIIGSEAIINYKDTYMDWLGSTKPEVKVPVNELLVWENIKKSKLMSNIKMDLVGANHENISTFKSRFEPTLKLSFIVSKKNTRGRLAEFAYVKLIKRRTFV